MTVTEPHWASHPNDRTDHQCTARSVFSPRNVLVLYTLLLYFHINIYIFAHTHSFPTFIYFHSHMYRYKICSFIHILAFTYASLTSFTYMHFNMYIHVLYILYFTLTYKSFFTRSLSQRGKSMYSACLTSVTLLCISISLQ